MTTDGQTDTQTVTQVHVLSGAIAAKKRWVKTIYDYEKHVLHAFVIFIAPETTVWKLKRILNMCALYLCFKTLSFQIIGFCRTNGVYPLCALLTFNYRPKVPP